MAKRKATQTPKSNSKTTPAPAANSTPPDQRAQPPPPRLSYKALLENLTYPAALLTLASISSPISQATLAPVFGSIPSAIHHQEAIIASTLLAWTLHFFLPRPPRHRVIQWTAIWAFWIPVLQALFFQYSAILGPKLGPALLGFLSCHTLLIPSVYAAAEAIDAMGFAARYGKWYATVTPAAVGTWHLVSAEAWFQSMLPSLTTVSGIFSPVSMQLGLAAVYSALAPSTLLIYALPTLLHTMYLNPHFYSPATTAVLNSTLRQHDWSLLARDWSITGYISVLENTAEQYRVLRCEHSLLGGEWQLTDRRRQEEGWTENESIYSVFEMLEAVRLIDRGPPEVLSAQPNALVVGLGIGTAAKALINQRIDTTVLELDYIIYTYAQEYFSLPSNHTVIIGDAIPFVTDAAANITTTNATFTQYDYIIHDVFTGGAEPLSLFTDKFLTNLRKLLKANGAIALNYAGDLSLPLTSRVLNTIDRTFAGQCTLYRDATPEDKKPADAGNIHADFANLVIFCRNAPAPITFLPPDGADVSGRKSFARLDPKLEIPFPLRDSKNRTAELEDQILRSGEEELWFDQQAESAIRHWHIMRSVIPDVVWELW